MSVAGRHPPLPAAAGVLLALGLPMLGLPALLFGGTPIGARMGREIVWIGLALFVLLWVTRVERRPLASIGLVWPTWRTLGWGLAGTVALIASVMLSYALIFPALGLHQNMAKTASIVQVPLWLMLTTPIVAGVAEEIVYRGYAIERLDLLTGRRWLAALLAGGAFLLGHLGWGGPQLILVGLATAILTGLYLWKRDLPACMIAHALTDLIGFALARAQM